MIAVQTLQPVSLFFFLAGWEGKVYTLCRKKQLSFLGSSDTKSR